MTTKRASDNDRNGLAGVLIVGSPSNRELGERIFDCGFTPVYRETILRVIALLHRERFRAVVVDPETVRVDALELILNIRDVDEETPIVVLANRRAGVEALARVAGVSVIATGKVHEVLLGGKDATAHRARRAGAEGRTG